MSRTAEKLFAHIPDSGLSDEQLRCLSSADPERFYSAVDPNYKSRERSAAKVPPTVQADPAPEVVTIDRLRTLAREVLSVVAKGVGNQIRGIVKRLDSVETKLAPGGLVAGYDARLTALNAELNVLRQKNSALSKHTEALERKHGSLQQQISLLAETVRGSTR